MDSIIEIVQAIGLPPLDEMYGYLRTGELLRVMGFRPSVHYDASYRPENGIYVKLDELTFRVFRPNGLDRILRACNLYTMSKDTKECRDEHELFLKRWEEFKSAGARIVQEP